MGIHGLRRASALTTRDSTRQRKSNRDGQQFENRGSSVAGERTLYVCC